MKRSWKILIVLFAVLALAILAGVIRHFQLRAATEACITQLKAEGEMMDLAQVLPPPVPPEQNSADVFRHVAALMKTNHDWWSTNVMDGMRMIAPGKAMVVWQQPEASGYESTNSWKNIGDALAQDRQILDLSHQIIDKPDFDFQIQYDVGVGSLTFTNFYLAESKRAAQRLATATLYDLHTGDTSSAVENVRAIIALSKAMRHERFVISELLRIVIAQIAMSANWELLRSTNLTDGQLAQLQQDWSDLDFIKGAENGMQMERVSGEISLGKWRNSNSEMEQYIEKMANALNSMDMGDGEETFWHKQEMKTEIFIWRYWESYPDEILSQKGYKVLLDAFRMAQTNGSFQSAIDYQYEKLDEMRLTNVPDIFDPNPNFHSFLSDSIGTLRAVLPREMRGEAGRRIMVTAIALKRYQLKHGDYPTNLDSLVPEFVSAAPMDPVDGKPLRYRRNADGTHLLYSIAANNKDDGGNPALKAGTEDQDLDWLNRHALDWVWPQTATAAEIEYFYAHPPK